MRMTVRVLVVATATVLFIAGGQSPDRATDTRGETTRAAIVVSVPRAQQPPDTDRAKQAAEAEREAGDDDRGGDD